MKTVIKDGKVQVEDAPRAGALNAHLQSVRRGQSSLKQAIDSFSGGAGNSGNPNELKLIVSRLNKILSDSNNYLDDEEDYLDDIKNGLIK